MCAMSLETEDLLRDLSQNAESVCRHYLPAGRREGSYWMVGDLQNTPGRSLFVRLTGPTSGPGAAGKFTDSATGEHGDLLDIIRERTVDDWEEMGKDDVAFRLVEEIAEHLETVDG